MAATKANKKANKKETEGNVLMFYSVQYSASSVFKTKVTPRRIKYNSATKAQVIYELESGDGIKLISTKDGGKAISEDQKKELSNMVNSMLSIETKVLCSKLNDGNNNDIKIPDGIGKNCDLYNIKINDCSGISHIPITMTTLGMLIFELISMEISVF